MFALGEHLTARDWIELGLRTLFVYPMLVVVAFIMRLVFSDIEPFELALLGVGPFFGTAVAERWRQNRAKDRNARLAEGEPATMQCSFKGGNEQQPTRWRIGRLHLTGDALRFRPLYYPRTPSPSFPLGSLEVLKVGHHQGWRKRVMPGFRVVGCRTGSSCFELRVMTEDLPGLLSKFDHAGEWTRREEAGA